jgi:type I restriction enzyme S subunit
MKVTANEGEVRKFQLQEKDVLITKDSEDPLDIGVPALINEVKGKLLCGYHLSMLRSKSNKITGDYLFWLLKDTSIASQLWREATGVTRWAIASRHVKDSIIALPSKKEQIAITDYLGKACKRIDKIIEIKEKQIKKIKKYYFSELDSLLTCKNNNDGTEFNNFIERIIPKEWKADRLRDITIINDKALSSSTDNDFRFKYIDISNVDKNGIINENSIKEMNFVDAPSRARRITKKNDVIISSVRTNLQAVAYLNWNEVKDIVASTGFFVVRSKFPEILLSKFLYYFLLTAYSRDYFFANSTGVSYPAINDYKFGSIYLFVPPINEQKEIVDKLDNLKKYTRKLEMKLLSQVKTLKNYRKSLIHECVTGKKQVI